ncbi:MAG: sugar lyase, partial [Paludibacteraceae bacterium]|nr:sugar lyase [Paludibacteraceae bacterium]
KRNSKDNSIYTFVFWIYNTNPAQGSLRFEFMKQGRVCCWFDYGLDFSGWHGAWVALKRDMQGTPEEGMDQLRISPSKGLRRGSVCLDHVILSSLQDSRQHTADFSAPFINPHTTNHWLTLLRSWNDTFDISLPQQLTERDRRDLQTIEKRLDKLLITKQKQPVSQLRERYQAWQITTNADRTLKGQPMFFERFGETYEHLGGGPYAEEIGPMGLAILNRLLLDLALTCRNTQGEDAGQCADMFISLLRHSMDQGLQAGSAMGTLHHLGYSMRDYYTAVFLMREAIRKAGLTEDVQRAVEWFSGAGELKHRPATLGMDMDSFNTNLVGRLVAVLLMTRQEEQVRYMQAFTRWFDNGLQYSDGLAGSFKPDGTAFHHCNHYPAYAIGGMRGASNGVWLLHQTRFRVSERGHQNLKQALMAMRLYCNLREWPISLSGRHPDGRGALQPATYARLAEAGTPDGTARIDSELVAVYKRLTADHPTGKFSQFDIAAESTPEGHWAFPYSCLNVHRRNEWMVAVKGHSRYIWNTETYRGCNLYGRYLNYGNIQILHAGNPISNAESGYSQKGWDWNYIPGTTTIVQPISGLRADIGNIGDDSGYEEMLQSDESFCNGLALNGQGAWGMKLHSHDKYDGSLRARKSVFCFDNRIVCLGSDITCKSDSPVVTTLFQESELRADDELETRSFRKPVDNVMTVRTGRGLLYAVPQGTLCFYRGLQNSLDQKTDQPTQGRFERLWLDHGVRPDRAKYEYMILVPETPEDPAPKTFGYRVLQQDSMAHIVTDSLTQTTAYVLFEPQACMNNSLPCLIMTHPTDQGLQMAVSDPDLHLYEGPADEIYDENGRRKERIIYGYKWNADPSRPSTVSLTVDGRYRLQADSADVRCQVVGSQTQIDVRCQHGMAQTFSLVRLP